MKNILKQFGVSDMNSKNNNFKHAVLKLTGYYSIGIFIVVLIFSSAFYFIFSSQINSHIEELETFSEESLENELLEDSPLHELQENLLNIIGWLDALILVLIITGSYFLSKKTLQPLEESYNRQKMFIANASHELKTPLTIIKAGSETLLRKERSIDEYKVFIADLLEETDRLSNLSNDLLYLSNDNFKIKNDSINVSEIIKKYSANIKAYSDNKKIDIKLDIEDNIELSFNQGDFVRLFLNLLKNAIDYSNDSAQVFVMLAKKHKSVHLEIKDTGIGIAEDKLNLILEPFYKIDDSRSTHSGNGLGLSIVKEIVDKYNGTVSFESALGQGTTVRVSFPSL